MSDDTYVVFGTAIGNFVVELYNNITPNTVANFLSYVENTTPGDSYNGSFFHRLVSGFVLQGGGYYPSGNQIAAIPTSAPIASEYSPSAPNVEGTIAMALAGGDPNSATDEFFFNLQDNSSLLDNTSDGGPFTAFGMVVENWSLVQQIAASPTAAIPDSNPNADNPFADVPIQGTLDNGVIEQSNLYQYDITVVQPISGAQAGQAVLDDKAIAPLANVTLLDPGNISGSGDTVVVTIEDSTGAANASLGTLSLPASAGTLTESTTTPGSYTISSFTTIAALQSALQQLVFTPTELASGTSPVTVTFDVDLDEAGGGGTLENNDASVVVTHDSSSLVTVMAADGSTQPLTFGSGAQAATATTLLAGVAASTTLYIETASAYTLGGGQNAAIDSATGSVSLQGNGAANETIAASSGAFYFTAGTGGSGTVIAGSGNDFVFLPGGGNWLTSLGNGVDTVVALTGNDTVSTGSGGSLLFLGSGTASISSGGADTIVGSTGAATVNVTGSSGPEVFALGGSLDFIGGSGASTVVAGTAGATVTGSSAPLLMFSDGPTQYTGAGGVDTLVGLNGSITAQGGAGGGVYFGGTAGSNVITAGSGNVTAFGAGAGDVLTATGTASDLFAGGVGAETLTGANSSGSNTFFAGIGPETLIGGSGSTALVAGAGADLMTPGTGLTLFLFLNGRTSGAADTITGFNTSEDFVKIAGYTGSEQAIVAAATVQNGSSTITLADGTHITFAGVTSLSASSFN